MPLAAFPVTLSIRGVLAPTGPAFMNKRPRHLALSRLYQASWDSWITAGWPQKSLVESIKVNECIDSGAASEGECGSCSSLLSHGCGGLRAHLHVRRPGYVQTTLISSAGMMHKHKQASGVAPTALVSWESLKDTHL